MPPKVNEALRDKVVAAARSLGYQADDAFVMKACQLQVTLSLLWIERASYVCTCVTQSTTIPSLPSHACTHTPINQHQELLDVRHSVMLLGPAGCAKTAIWKTLAAAHNLELRVRPDFIRFLSRALGLVLVGGDGTSRCSAFLHPARTPHPAVSTNRTTRWRPCTRRPACTRP